MRKLLFNVLLLTLFSNTVTAQLSGALTVPGTYTSIAAAITDLNLQGVNGATTIQISPNYTETVPTGGFSLTATGTAVNPIIFQKNGAGANPLLIAYAGGVGTPTTAVQDGIWRLIGSDYITIDGIDLLDQNAANPATMEFGYGLFKASTTDGCRNNTIKNCVITLNRINNVAGAGPAFEGSRGIDMVNAFVNSHTVAVAVAAGAGANGNNRFYANTIRNCHIGIALSGVNVAVSSANIDAANDVGGTLASTGNTIHSFGSGPGGNNAYAIRSMHQNSLNVAYNAINTSTTSGVSLYGIHLNSTHNMTVANNSITINGNYISCIYSDNVSGGATANIVNNSILNCSCTSSFYGIESGALPGYINISNNLISGLTFTTGNGFVHGIHVPNTSSSQRTLTLASNTITNMTNLNSNTSIYGIYVYTGHSTSYTIQSNYVNNLSRKSGQIGDLYGIWNEGTWGNMVTNAGYVLNNVVTNLTNGSSSNSQDTYGIYYQTDYATYQYAGENLVSNITGGNGLSYGIYMNDGSSGSSAISNTVTNISSAGRIYGIMYANSGYNISLKKNLVGGLTSTGASTVFGICSMVGTSFLHKNKVYDISCNGAGGAYVYGMFILGEKCELYNNIVGDLRTPNSDYADAITGIFLWGSGNNPDHKVYYNTVRIDAVTSGGLYFGGSAFSHLAGGTPTLTLRNNIFINLATPNGGSSVAAFKRNAASLTLYSTASNNNLFYAGTPSANNLIYMDGTNNMQTLSAFKTLVSPREPASVTENTPFLSLSGPSASFLHVSPPSLAESNAVNIPSSIVTDDIDGNSRHGNPGYIGNGTAPDIGADEFDTPLCSTVNASTLTPASLSICAGQTVSITRTSTTMAVFAGTQLQWQRSLTSGGPYTLVAAASATSTSYTSPTLSPGTYYYAFVSSCPASSQTAVSNEVTVSVYPYPQPTLSPVVPVICSGSSSSVAITATGANQFSWSPSGNLSSNSGSMVTANPATTETFIVTGINPGGCTGSSTFTVYVYPNPTISVSGNTLVCAGKNLNLTVSGADSYLWSNGATQPVISPIVSTTTVFTVVGTSTLGNCTSTAQHTVSVNPNPTLTASGATVLCAGQSANLNVSGADTYTWSTNVTTHSITVTPPSTTVYNVIGTFSATGCTSTAQQVVTVIQIPVVGVSGPSRVCSGQSAILTAFGATNYTWSTGATSPGITITLTATTNYTITGVTGPGCTGTTIKTILVDPLPTATISSASPSVICEGESMQLVASSDIGNLFNWNHGPTGAMITVAPAANTSYIVVVRNSATNCTNSAVYDLTVDPCTGINKVSEPNLITVQPNPFHSQFSIYWYGAEETKVEIFNATGSLIMSTRIEAGHNDIKMDKFAKGLYYVKVNTQVKKIVSE